MKNLKIYFIAIIIIFSSCASSKEFNINGEITEVKPYGWANKDARYNENVIYEVSAGNIIWSIIGIETIILPVWLTGWQFFEPVKLKEQKNDNTERKSF